MKSAPTELPTSAAWLLAELAGVLDQQRKRRNRHSRGADMRMRERDVAALLAAELLARGPDGALTITSVGQSHLARFAAAGSDAAIDPFRAQHLSVARRKIGGMDDVAWVDDAESPLVWLARRKSSDGRSLIEPVQLQAGERLRADFTRAQMMPRTGVNWTATATDGQRGLSISYSDAVIAARQRLQAALNAVGPEFSGLLLDVCCFLKGLTDIERERNWPARSAKVVLQLGLDRLARHYGLAAQAHGPAHAPVRAWLAPDAEFVSE